MTEQDSKDKYIKCSRCKCKYINDDNHIKTDFGYNRLNERYKTCLTCRDRHKQYVSNNKEQIKDIKHAYWINHKDEIHNKREELKKLAEESNGTSYYCNRCYQIKLFDDFVCPNGKTYNACYKCLDIRYNQTME